MGWLLLNNQCVSVFIRSALLFTLGGLFTLVINIMQVEYKTNIFHNNFILFLKTYWWVVPCCGIAAVYIGIMYPYFDHLFGECHHFDREWATILRAAALFIGLNQLCAKLTFPSTNHFFVLLMTFCILFWVWFDKTKCGLLFTIIHALFVIVSTYIFRSIGIVSVLNEINYIQFNYLQTCLLWFVFSGCITIGNIGRLMNQHKEHLTVKNDHQD